jgi:mannose-6-phosphate isomerase-like protein (cupin superfamily)
MPIIDNNELKAFNLPGLHHRTLAGFEQGLKSLSVWSETVEPGAGTPVHRHDCEEAVVILEGNGTLTVNGEDTKFGPNTTLIVPPDAVHQIVNSGTTRMVFIGAFSTAPVKVRDGENNAMALPWQASK